MATETLKDLLVDEIRDIYHAEKQLLKALPKMAKAASSKELAHAFEAHLEETRVQTERLEKVFQLLEVPARAKKCEAMEGLIEEGEEALKSQPAGPLRDVALSAAARKVEHYEFASYCAAAKLTVALGLRDVTDLLVESKDEEEAADKKVIEICGGIVESYLAEGEPAMAGARSGNRSKAAVM